MTGLIRDLLAEYEDIGALPNGGVTRLSYSPEEDEMHRIFRTQAEGLGFQVWEDGAGNSFAANFPQGDTGYTLIASHLDSVIEGGRYDGAAGVAAGLAVLRELKRLGADVPAAVAAFRCEESSNFRICTVGSGLITHTAPLQELREAVGRDGVPFVEKLRQRGLTMDVPLIEGVDRYLELHIEQGRVLESGGYQAGIVTAIAAPHRYTLRIEGMAEHSGATPMSIRRDALCGAAEIILGVEELGQRESEYGSVATVGAVENHPNIMNAIPGTTRLQIDLRCVDTASMRRMDKALRILVSRICIRRGLNFSLKREESKSPARLDRALVQDLQAAAERAGLRVTALPSGAGHDALSFTELCPTGMVFVPCREGISHNINEHTEPEQIADGARVLVEYLSPSVSAS